MEFKNRAVDKKPTMTSCPFSTVTYVSERSLHGAGEFSGMPNTFQVPVAGEALRRELEKDQIRREIMASESVQKRVLEEEVRREMMLERVLMQRSLLVPFSFQDRVALWSNPMMNVPIPIDDIIDVSRSQLPQVVAPGEIKPSPQIEKDKVIMLPKQSNRHSATAKRKAVTPAVSDIEPSGFGLKKKTKEEWRCALCDVGATSERDLNNHLHGRKHKAKEATVNREESVKPTHENFIITIPGLGARTWAQFPQPSITMEELTQAMAKKAVMEPKNEKEEEEEEKQLVEESQNIIGGLENKNGKETEEAAGKTNALAKRKVTTLWCEVCQIHTFSPIVMETHKKGKKHLRQMMKFSQNNNASVSPTCSISHEAPGLMN